MSLESSIEAVRALLETLRKRVDGSVRQKGLKEDLLEGLDHVGDALCGVAAEAGPPQTAAVPPAATESGAEERRKLSRALRACSRSNRAMIAATEEAQYLQDVCRIVVEDCGHALVWIGYAEEDGEKAVRPVASSGFEEGYLESLRITWDDSERGRGPTGTAIRTGLPAVCRDMQKDPQFAPWRGEALKRGYASSVVVPLLDETRAFGAVSIYSREADAFSDDEVGLLSDLARDLSFGIRSIRLRRAHAEGQELLRRSEERFREIVELSPDAVLVNHNGRVSYINPAGIKLFGARSEEEILGKSPFELFARAYHATMLDRITALLRGESVPLTETKIVRLDGAHREVEASAALCSVQEGRAIQVILRDITRRKQTEDELVRSHSETQERAAETEAVLAAMNDVVLVYDADMNVMRVSPGFKSVYGFDPVGMNVREIIRNTRCRPVDDVSEALQDQPTPSALRGQPVLNRQFRITRHDGQERVLETSSTPLRVGAHIMGAVTVWHDITERKAAEEAISLERANLQAVMDVANFGLMLLDGHGTVKRLNATLSRWSGMVSPIGADSRPGDLVGCIHALSSRQGCGHTEHCGACAIRSTFESVLRTGAPVHNVETRAALLVDGREVDLWLEISADPLVLDGKPHVVLGMANITDRKQSGEALQREKNRLEAVMAALPVGVAITDKSGGTVQANAMFEEIWGGARPPATTVGDYAEYKAWWADHGRLVQPGEWASAQAITRGVSVVGQVLEIERFDGSHASVLNGAAPIRDADGNIDGSAVAIQDITELRRAQKAVHESEERLRLALDAATMAAWDWQVATGEVLWNDEHYRMLGYGVGEVQPSYESWAARLHPDDRPAVELTLRQSMEGGADYAVQFRVLWPNGETRWVEARGRTELDGDGHPARNYGVMLDITDRKQAHEELERSEERFRTLFLSLNEGYYVAEVIHDSQGVACDYRFLEVNPAFEQIVGRDRSEIVGRRASELVPNMSPEWMGVFLSVAATGEPRGCSFYSEVFHRHFQAYAFRPAEGQVAVLVADTTDRARAEQVLRENEARLRTLGDNLPEGAIYRYVQDSEGRRAFEFVSAGIERITGVSPAEILADASALYETIPPEERARMARLEDESREKLTPFEVEVRQRNRATGEVRWSLLRSMPHRREGGATVWDGVQLDITGRKKFEEQLGELTQRLTYHVDNSPLAVIEWGPDMRLTRWSGAAEKVFGWTAAEVLGRRMEDLRWIHEEDQAQVDEVSGDLRSGRNPRRFSENRNYRKDGSVVHCEWYNSSLRDESGELQSILSLVLDVTERKRAEEALRLAHEGLERRVEERTAELSAANEALQKEMEARQRAREVASRLAAIVSSSDDAILSKTPDGIILTWNKGAERLFGYPERDVVGRHVSFLTPEDRSNETEEILAKIRRGERIERFETIRVGSDGTRIDVSLTISPILDATGRVVGSSEIAHDITGRKQMEDELRHAWIYARSLIEASLDPLVTIGLSGEITDVNEAMERVTGVPRSELLGSRFRQYVTEPEKAAAVYERVLAEGSVKDLALTIRHRSGTTTDVLYNAAVYRDASGEIKGVFTAARDITERKRAEDEIARYRDHLEDLVRQRTAELEIAYQRLQEDIAARERLEAERLRLIDILEATSDMVSYADASGRVLYFNQAARKVLGIPPGMDLAQAHVPAVYPDWANRLLQEVAIPTAVLEDVWAGESAVLDADGREIPVSQVIVAHKDAGGQVAYFSTIARDMTAQKRIEHDLKVLASFPAENPSPVMRIQEDGILLYANEPALPLLNVWECAVGGRVPSHVRKTAARALARAKIQESEYEAGGRYYSVLFAPIHQTRNVNMYGRDITERRQIQEALVQARDELERRVEDRTAELLQVNVALLNKIEEHARTMEALRNSQVRLAEAQRIAHLGGWEWDIRSGTLIWSDEVFRIFGMAPGGRAPTFSEFIGWMPPEDARNVERSLFRAIAEKKPFNMDHRILLAGGDARHVHAQAELVFDDTGTPVRMIGTIMDITERVRAAEEARIRQQQLVQADKMVSLGILVAGVAHEINNPNHSIMSNVTALSGVWEGARPILERFYSDFGDFVLGGFDYSECREKVSEMFSNALSNSKRIEVIVTELRDFARNSPRENMAPVDVNAVVKSAIILMANMVKKSTDHFSAEYGAGLPPVVGNFQRIEQVVINLIQNACQALASRDREVCVATMHDTQAGVVLIEVRDEGVGIPEENMEQLGTPFFTTKRGSEGMGLGLWISSNIAHEHGGMLRFYPREGGGTRAVLALPEGHAGASDPPEELTS